MPPKNNDILVILDATAITIFFLPVGGKKPRIVANKFKGKK